MRDTEDIYLSLHSAFISVDADGDSSQEPADWIDIYGEIRGDDVSLRLTFEEATELRDRLTLLIGE